MAERISQGRLHDLLAYDRQTGLFVWRVCRRGNVKAGDVAGSLQSDGYIRIQVEGVGYQAHVLAHFHMTGEWPAGEVDHRDGVRSNNCEMNLRDATVQVNRQNLRAATSRNKSSRLLGVHLHDRNPSRKKRWRASIVVGGKRVCLGSYETPELAHSAYIAAKRQLHEGNTL